MGDPPGCGYREFASGEAELRAFVAARVWALEEGPRALFDRAVLWLIEHCVLLPGITVLARVVAEVRAAEHERLHGMLAGAPAPRQLQRFEQLLVVPEGARRSKLDQLRSGKVNPEEQLGALGLIVNAIVLCNTIYTQRALDHLAESGQMIDDADIERLSPPRDRPHHAHGPLRIALLEALRDRGSYRELNTTPAVAA